MTLGCLVFVAGRESEKSGGGKLDILPRPRVVKLGGEAVKVKDLGEKIGVAFKNLKDEQKARIKESIRIVSKRLSALGGSSAEWIDRDDKAQIVIENCETDALAKILNEGGAKGKIEPCQLDQGYYLQIQQPKEGSAPVSIKACTVMGISYALMSLCQLLDKDDRGEIVLPAVTIYDWPVIGFRLAKTSASEYPSDAIKILCRWSALFKINQVGLQYHGDNSKNPGRFTANVKELCQWMRRSGAVEPIVYFCPFRGKGGRSGSGGGDGAYNLAIEGDRKKCVDYFLWFLEQGARGVEIDYNDWFSTKPPIEDVINLIYEAVRRKDPHVIVLYCPPSGGASQYRGPASSEMARILSKVPADVLTLWTGPATGRPVITDPLPASEILAWTEKTKRKPFLWINRAFANGVFARESKDVPGYFIFRGELLPKDLDRYVEGIHLNAGLARGDVEGGYYRNAKLFPLPDKPTPETIAYLATAADFLWNPSGWEGEDSCRRAKRLVEIMLSLLEEEGKSGKK